jgi:DNA segregation ATPase FtsK/SpoIIIE-like protein
MGRDHPYLIFIRIAAIVLMTGGLSHVFAQTDPPGRVARINYSEGNVAFAPSTEKEWTDADLNRPLVAGDKLWTDKNVRAEIQIGSSLVRMDGRTRLTVLALDDRSAQLSVTQGTVYMRVRNLLEGENFEIDTPNLAYRAAYPGEYRIDVDAQQGVTRVTISSGTGAVYGDKGQALPLGGGQQISFKGRALDKVNVQESPPQDNFDRWAAERNRRDDQSVAARYVPRDAVGYPLLDAAGEWREDANYGAVWFPQGMPAKWAPFRDGKWEWIVPWGWTWVDDAPWAFVTSHYGRWAQIGTRWAWAPGRMGLRPIYAPALVAFVGSGNSPLSVGGKATVAWIPLAPGEAWQPPYPATQLYVSSVNANMPPLKEGSYAYQRKPDALTAISLDDFHRGKPSKGSWLHVAANALTNAQVTAPPAVPDYAKSTAVAARAPVQAPPQAPQRTQPTVPEIQQVANSGPTVQQQIDAQKRVQLEAQAQAQREQERVQREKQTKADEAKAEQDKQDKQAQQKKVTEQRRIAQQLRVAEQARRAEQQKAAQEQQRIAEQTRRAEQQKQARAAEAARVAQARHEAVAAKRAEQGKRAEQAKRELVAKREREAKAGRELQAKRAQEKKDEQTRRAAHTQQVEQARRAAERDAQVLAQQRIEREAQQRKVAEDKERAQRDAWQKQQQALADQWKRDQQAWDAQQRAKAQRGRPDLHKSTTAPGEPEVWQRGIPILAPGRTS